MDNNNDIGPEEASRIIKKYAEKQKIEIKLSEDQLQAILEKWNDKDPKMPAEISFYVDDREMINLKVAGYRYRGSTCCV
jgi:cytochrome c551/c552